MPAALGWIISGLITGITWLFKNRIGQFITAILAFLGISLATYTFAVQPFIDQLESMANAGMGGGQFSAFALNFLGIMNFDKALTMIISAVAAKHAVGAGKVFFKKVGA